MPNQYNKKCRIRDFPPEILMYNMIMSGVSTVSSASISSDHRTLSCIISETGKYVELTDYSWWIPIEIVEIISDQQSNENTNAPVQV